MTGYRFTRPRAQTAASWFHHRQAEAVASAQKEQKEASAASGGSSPRDSSRWTSPASQGASLGSGRGQTDVSLDQSCFNGVATSLVSNKLLLLLPPTPDHSWVYQGAAHSNEFRAADRKRDTFLCGRSDRHRSLRVSDYNGDDRLLLEHLDLLLHCWGRNSGDQGR